MKAFSTLLLLLLCPISASVECAPGAGRDEDDELSLIQINQMVLGRKLWQPAPKGEGDWAFDLGKSLAKGAKKKKMIMKKHNLTPKQFKHRRQMKKAYKLFGKQKVKESEAMWVKKNKQQQDEAACNQDDECIKWRTKAAEATGQIWHQAFFESKMQDAAEAAENKMAATKASIKPATVELVKKRPSQVPNFVHADFR